MLFHYALNYIQRHKKQSVYLINFMALFTALLIGVQISGASYKEKLKNDKDAHYGIWQVELIHLDLSIDQSPLYENTNHLLIYEVAEVDNEYLNLCFIEGDYEKMLSYHLTQGRMPKTENEIAISERALFQLDLLGTLNQTVTLNINGKPREYTLVGITDFYNDDHCNYFYPPLIVCPQDYQAVNLYLADLEDNTLIDTLKYESTFFQPDKTYGLGNINSLYINFKSGQYTLTVLLMTALCGSLLMMNFSYAISETRTKEFALLRGIGATKRQMYLISIIETTLLFLTSIFISIPLSSVCYFIYTHIIPVAQTNMLISVTEIVLLLFLAYLITLFSFVHPVSRAIQNALTGTFDSVSDPLIKAHYTKLKVLDAKQLALRYLKNHKKDTILMLILLTSSMFCFHYMINNNLKFQTIIDNLVELDKNYPYIVFPKEDTFSDEELSVIKKSAFQNYLIQKYMIDDVADFVVTLSNDNEYQLNDDYYQYAFIPLTEDVIELLEYYGYEGKMPTKPNEILTFEHLSDSLLYKSEKDYLNQNRDVKKISYHKEALKITGTAIGIELPYPFMNSLNSYSNLFYHYLPFTNLHDDLKIFYVLPGSPLLKDLAYNEEIILKDGSDTAQLKSYFQDSFQKIKYASHGFIIQQQDDYENAINSQTRMYTIITILLLLMCFLTHIQRIHQNREEMAIFSLMGMTRKEIIKKYSWQGLLITVFPVSVVIGLYIYFGHLSMKTILPICLTFLILIIFYMLPVWIIIPKNSFDYLNQKEDY